jgi:transposase
MPKPAVRLPVEEKVQVVVAVLAGEMTAVEAARRHGVSGHAVQVCRAKFLDAGRRVLEDRISGPGKGAGTPEERRQHGCTWRASGAACAKRRLETRCVSR